MNNVNDFTFAAIYEAGLVKRHHTNPSDAVQTIGHHSWGVAMILDHILPEASKTVLLAALRHDVPERWTGDVPAPIKWKHQALAREHAAVEDRTMELLSYDTDLTEHEAAALKTADMLELWLYSNYRYNLGDRFFREVKLNVETWFSENRHLLAMFPKARIMLHGI